MEAIYIFIFIVFLAAFAHELGHLILLSIFGFRVRIRITPAGIVIKKEGGIVFYLADLLIFLSGPLVNLICFLAFREAHSDILSIFSSVSLALALTNLIPIKGLDGYEILFSLCALFSGSRASLYLAEVVSLVFTASAFVLSLVLLLSSEANISFFVLYSWLFYNNYLKKQKNS